MMRGYDIQKKGESRRRKTEKLEQLEKWDSLAEERELSVEEWTSRYMIEAELEKKICHGGNFLATKMWM